MRKHVNLVDLVKSFPTNILLQNLASIQKRTSPIKFAQLAEKSEKGSISNLSTKVTMGAGSSSSPLRCASGRVRLGDSTVGGGNKFDHAPHRGGDHRPCAEDEGPRLLLDARRPYSAALRRRADLS